MLLALGRCRSRVVKPSLLQSALLIVLYIGGGTIFYRTFDEKDCESDKKLRAVGYDEETCKESWTFVDALYFSIVTMSTVGYGDLTPSNDESKVFTVFYILFGIVVVWVRVLTVLTQKIEAMRAHWARGVDTVHARAVSGVTERNPRVKVYAHVFWIKGLGFSIICIVATQLAFAGIFSYCEDEVGFGDALYHCMVTATTVGYGDISLTRQASRLWASIHIVLSVTWLAALFANIDELRIQRRLELKRIELLDKPLDEERIRQLDKGDGQGVDKCEFVVGMLMMLGAEFGGRPLEWEDVKPFIERFEAMDKDRDQHLTVDDIVSSIKDQQTLWSESAKSRSGQKATSASSNARAIAPDDPSPTELS